MSLFSTLGSTANTLAAFSAAFNVSQNNVANVSTPGYARQTQTLSALPFDPANNLIGGVSAGEIQSARDIFAEQNVRGQNSQLGTSEQLVASLTSLQGNFDITGTTGIPGALSRLSAAFSNWSINPNDPTARQNVIQVAANVVNAFHQTAGSLAKETSEGATQAKSLVTQINDYSARIRADNLRIQAGDKNDAGLSADLSNTIESLSELANVTTLNQPDGTVSVLLGGQFTLVAGSQQYKISASFSIPSSPPPTYASGPPTAHILDSQGNDVTASVTDGKLGGILTVLNQALPAIRGDSTQAGSLNELAKAFADNVNRVLTAGSVSSGPPVQTGSPLFSYDAASGTNVAASLSLDPAATAQGLAAITPANPSGIPPTPEVSNGAALTLAGLASAAGQIDGQSFTQFFGNIAAKVGLSLSAASNNQTLQTSLVAQARSLRSQSSGVDLNQEAVNVVELQTAYQAATKILTVIDSLTQSILDLIK